MIDELGIVLIVWSKGWTRCFDSAVDKLRHCFVSVVYSMRHCFGGGWCVEALRSWKYQTIS